MKPSAPTSLPDETDAADADGPPFEDLGPAVAAPALPDLSSLPVAGITRRRVGFLLAALVSVWVVIVFARQVGEATAATARVDAVRDQNAALEGRLVALQREAELIQRQEWVVQQANGYRLGEAGATPFALGEAADLPPDAPGSASVSLGATTDERTPLESWLSLLFGPSR